MSYKIESWTPDHQRWQELRSLIAAEGQSVWAFEPYFESSSRHFLVAHYNLRLGNICRLGNWPA